MKPNTAGGWNRFPWHSRRLQAANRKARHSQRPVPGKVEADGQPESARLQVSKRKQYARQHRVYGAQPRGMRVADVQPSKENGGDSERQDVVGAFDNSLKGIAAEQQF